MTQLKQQLLPIELLGTREIREGEGLVYFGLILPPKTNRKSAIEGYDLWIRVIHNDDQFIKSKKPIEAPLETGSFSDVACLLYRKATNQEPKSSVQAYQYLRNSKYGDSTSEPQYIQALLDYEPNEFCKDEKFFWYYILDLKSEEPERFKDEFKERKNSYVYRYFLRKKVDEKDENFSNPLLKSEEYDIEQEIDWIIDPFAREFGKGNLSAFSCGYQKFHWSDREKDWRVPALNDLIIYEMMLDEFNEDIDGAIEKIPYLEDLGINCISLMPITNVDTVVDWGYTPIGYFGIDERFGRDSRQKLKEFIDLAHQHGIAVLFDAVYAHTSPLFFYYALYERIFIDSLILKEQEGQNTEKRKREIKEKYRDASTRYEVYDKKAFRHNPFMGNFSKFDFGKSVDFNKKFAADFFFTVSYYWLDEFHFDGFRYDYVPGYHFPRNLNSIHYDQRQEIKRQISLDENIKNKGFKPLVEGLRTLVHKAIDSQDSIPIDGVERFSSADYLIQSAENLEEPIETLDDTAANCTWQNQTMDAAKQVACTDQNYMRRFGLQIGLSFQDSKYPHKTQLQYIENHDNSRFVYYFGQKEEGVLEVFKEGDRDIKGYKVQPYLIALLTAKGIPLLWQGQEFCENGYVHPHGGAKGLGRIRMFRPIRWDYFYDDVGQATISLLRKLTRIRKHREQFCSLDPTTYYFHDDANRYQRHGILVYYRFTSCSSEKQPTGSFSIVMLNFTDEDKTVDFQFPNNPKHHVCFQNYRNKFVEELTQEQHRIAQTMGPDAEPPNLERRCEEIYDGKSIKINSNYGCIWTVQPDSV